MAFERLKSFFGVGSTNEAKASAPAAQNAGKRQLPPDERASIAEEAREWADERSSEIERQGARRSGTYASDGGAENSGRQTPDLPDGDLTIGMLTLKARNEDGRITATEGAVSVLGTNVPWTADKPVVLEYNSPEDIIAYGKVKVQERNVSFGEGETTVSANEGMSGIATGASDGIVYSENGVSIATGVYAALSLDEIVPKKLILKSPVIQNTDDKPFEGDLRITSTGVVGTASKSALGFDGAASDIIKSVQKQYVLKNDGGLKCQIDMPDAEIDYAIGKIFSITGKTPTVGDINSNGSYVYHVSAGRYSVSVFGKEPAGAEIPVGFDLICSDGGIAADKFNIHLDTFTIGSLAAANVTANVNIGEGSLSLSAESVNFENLPLTLSQTTITADSTGFAIGQASAKLALGGGGGGGGNAAHAATAEIKGLKYTESGLSIENISADVPETTVCEGFTLKSGSLSGSATEAGMDLSATVEAVLNYEGKLFKISAPDGVKASLSYHKSTGAGGSDAAGDTDAAPAEESSEGNSISAAETLGPDISVSLNGALSAALVINGEEKAAAKIANYSYDGVVMSFGDLALSGDISKIFGSLDGTDVFQAKKLVYSSADKTVDYSSLSVTLEKAKFKGKELPDITVKINKDSGASEQTPAEGDAEIPLDENTEADLKTLAFTLNIGQDPSLEIAASSLSANLGPFAVEAENAVITLSGTGFGSTFEKFGISNETFGKRIAEFCGMEGLALTLGDLSFGSDGFSVGEVGLQFSGDVKIFGNIHLTDPSIAYNFAERNLRLGFGLSYEGGDSSVLKTFGGSTSLFVSADSITLDEIKDLLLDFGKWGEGGIQSAKKTEEGLTLMGITLNRVKSDDDTQIEGVNPVLGKILGNSPDIKMSLKTLVVTNNGISPIKAEDFTIEEFSKEFEFTDGIKGVFKYSAAKGLGVGLNMKKSIPDNYKKGDTSSMERIVETGVNLKIVPGLLSAGANVHVDAGFLAALNVNTNVKKDDVGVTTFGGSADGNADGAVGAGIGIKLKVGIDSMGASLEIAGDLVAAGSASGNAAVQFKHDPSLPFLHSFSLDREQTSVRYNLKADLKFKLNANFDADTGLPAIFDNDKLYFHHTWNLKTVDLGSAELSGDVTYDGNKWVFTHAENIDFPGKFKIEHVEEKIQKFGTTYDSLERDMTALKDICSRVTENNIIGLDVLMHDKTLKGLGSLYGKLKDIRQQGMDNSLEAYKLMSELKKRLANTAEQGEKNLKEVEALENIESQSRQASDLIFGVDRAEKQASDSAAANAPSKTAAGMTAKDYADFMKRINAINGNADELDKLAQLDPVAVINMLKVYKIKNDDSWEGYRLNEKQRSLTAFSKMLVKDPTAPAVAVNNSSSNDEKTFREALDALAELQDNCYNKLADVQKEIDEIEEKIAAIEKNTYKRSAEEFLTSGKELKKKYQKLLEEKKLEKIKLLTTEVNGMQMSSSVKGFTEFLSVQDRYVQNMISAKGNQYRSVENVTLTNEVIISRRIWVSNILNHMLSAYWETVGEFLTPEMDIKDERGFEKKLSGTLSQASERRAELEKGEWFEDDLKRSYGLSAFRQKSTVGQFKKKKRDADEYTRLKKAYDDINSSLNKFFDLLRENMETTESLMVADFESMKSKEDYADKSDEIIDIVKKTDETQKAIPQKTSSSVEELLKRTA